jgi:hypothetical protein
MKHVTYLLASLLLLAGQAIAQTAYNPFTQNIHFEPEPTLLGFPCGSVQTVAFTQGLTTSANANLWQTQPLVVVICVTGFQINGPVSTAVFGDYASNFDWSFDSFAPNCIIGTQNQPLIGTGGNPIFPDPLSSGDIKLSLLVPETSPINTTLAVNVNLQVPGYMAQFNSAPDDNESVQTQTFCELAIKGTVYNDSDTLTNVNDVNGTPISAPDGEQLYASLISPVGVVLASVPVAANGTYTFSNVAINTNYTVVLSINPGVVGNAPPVIELPVLWVNTGEDCCDKIGNDGNPNGIVAVNVTNFSRINADFGIRKPGATGSLPTVLKNFFVSEYQCGGLLSWTTSQESNTSHVDVYRKENAQATFKKVATVQSAGNSATEKMYSYLDANLNPEMTYEYQLKFVDIDGQFTVSDIKTLRLDCSKAGSSLNLFPNPATKELNVLYVTESDQSELEVGIYDLAGRKLLSQSQLLRSGGNVLTLDIESFATGSYILHYRDIESGNTGSVQFVKQ